MLYIIGRNGSDTLVFQVKPYRIASVMSTFTKTLAIFVTTDSPLGVVYIIKISVRIVP